MEVLNFLSSNLKAHVVFICYDVTSRSSFENVHRWLSEVERYGSERICKIVVGISGFYLSLMLGCKRDSGTNGVVTPKEAKVLFFNIKIIDETGSLR